MGVLSSPVGVLCYSLEPSRKNWFTWSFQSPNGSVPDNAKYALQNFGDLANRISVEKYAPGNAMMSFPSLKEASSLTLNYIVLASKPIYDFWNQWFKLVYNEDTDEVGLYSDIIGSGTLNITDPGGSPIQTWNLGGIWPSSVGVGGGDMNDDGAPFAFNVNLEVTSIKPS